MDKITNLSPTSPFGRIINVIFFLVQVAKKHGDHLQLMIDQVTSERGPGIEVIFADDYNSHFNETETVNADVTSQTVTMTSQRPPTEQTGPSEGADCSQMPEVLVVMDSENEKEESYIKPTTDECKIFQPCLAKTPLEIFVVVIRKEGLFGTSLTNLLLV